MTPIQIQEVGAVLAFGGIFVLIGAGPGRESPPDP